MVISLTESALLINLTNMDGLFDKDPREHQDAQLIRVVEKVDRRVAKFAGSMPGFLGTGGMTSKIAAAEKAALSGVPTIIANGLKPGILKRLFLGEEEGTLFLPRKTSLCNRKQWIAFAKAPKGQLVIDRGAEKALVNRGKSLLPSGVIEVLGRFSQGDAVLLMSEHGKEIAVGMVNYHATEIRKLMGAKTSEIETRLGFKQDDEVVHRDNLVLMDRVKDQETP
jgi:glutamate 5-kinase